MCLNLLQAQSHWHKEVNPGLKAKVDSILSGSTRPTALREAILQELRKEGYWLSQIKIIEKDSSLEAQIEPGKPYIIGELKLELPADIDFETTQNQTENLILNRENWLRRLNQELIPFEENGFPFAQAQLSSYRIEGGKISGTLKIESGPYISLDSLALKGFSGMPPRFLRTDLGYYPGMPYRESFLKDLQERVQQIEFVGFSRPPAVAFIEDKSTLFLYLQEQKGNQIDGVIGLNTDAAGRSTLNGDFQLRLLNIFKKGEEINVRWRRPDESVQQFNFGFNWPYLFSTPIWLNASLEIFRQDSSFVNTESNNEISYLFAPGKFITGGFDYRRSTTLSDESNPAFSNLGAFNSTRFLLGTRLRTLNRAVIPTRGYQFQLKGFTGQRTSQNIQQEQYGWNVTLDHYWNFSKNFVLKSGLNSQALFGESLFENELYRIGGLRSLRGFNEQSIFSSAYATGILELRYMIGEFDYLTIFSDLAYSEKNTADDFERNFFTGLGTGLSFRTQGGIFSLFLAAGRSESSNFDLRATKIHFGYINRF